MGQRPDAKMFYGIHYKSEELPEDLADRIREMDPPDVIYEFMGIPDGLPFEERDKLKGTFGTFTLNNRYDLILYGFGVHNRSYGIKKFSMMPLEDMGPMRSKLLAIAEKAGLPAGKEPGWYLGADFE